jgi:predicted nuclease with RNAse H fold
MPFQLSRSVNETVDCSLHAGAGAGDRHLGLCHTRLPSGIARLPDPKHPRSSHRRRGQVSAAPTGGFELMGRRLGGTARGPQRIFEIAASASSVLSGASAAQGTAPMRTAGLDLSAAKERTAAVAISWRGDGATVAAPAVALGDEELVRRLAAADWIGIDAPFGWPAGMVEAVSDYAAFGRWPALDKDAFRWRRTEVFARETILAETGKKLWSMSVSADRLGLTARRTAQLREHAFESSGVRFDRSGADRVAEVYPSGALLLWGIERGAYKTSQDPSRREAESGARAELVAALEAKAPWLGWAPDAREACVQSDDALDALLAALIARAAALGLTFSPPPEDLELARQEGWIHLPQKDSLPLLLNGA